ncbi:hypothetical protein H2201_006286 [Coniosporium apollinis]|uniref:PRKR-interacting protein 1 n=2 Tax=Coniosporium TaxID=2810619 RepID=A0ABQ9NME4_9PEZI|nr:hypothetical protein H2199_004284 [Cladosporium sp. JES 115]KAJ9661997.1 hypothetical protein H2201_006286 [Coniosporium apollinis]
MSEPIPESIPTSADPRSKRPTKKRALTPVSAQANQVEALFAHPEREIALPTGPKPKNLAPPPEIVANVQGSSAGAGSGEFHVYKASRRREYERLRLMEEETKKENADAEFEIRREEMRRRDEAKTSKNKARREKNKARLAKKGKGGEGMEFDGDGESVVNEQERGRVKKLGPMSVDSRIGANGEADDGVLNGGGEVKSADEVGIIIHDED